MSGRNGSGVVAPRGADTTQRTQAPTTLGPTTLQGSPDRVLDELTKRVSELMARIGALPFRQSQYHRDLVFDGANPVRIAHGLGAQVAYVVARAQDANTPAYPVLVDDENDEKWLTLRASEACTVDLWIFPRPNV